MLGTLFCWACLEVDALARRRTPRIELINKWTARWARAMLRVFGIRIAARGPYVSSGRVYPGRDEQGVGRIFVMNHRAAVDIPVILSLAAAHAISRHDLAHWPLIGAGARRIGTLFVDRTSRRSGAMVLKQIEQVLAAGEGIAMFPEGTAFDGDEVRQFKPGAFKAARRAGAEIIPLGIAYGDRAAYYSRQPFLTHVKRLGMLARLNVAVEVGDPIRVGERAPGEAEEACRRTVEQLVLQARQRLGGEPHLLAASPPAVEPADAHAGAAPRRP
ncbi:MAG: hypothetical protein DCC67_05530 [Planctomycetota bacterium]|nr:MAG: hypothetical protein DCC67_05530 [Planctomycetota bacterium]